MCNRQEVFYASVAKKIGVISANGISDENWFRDHYDEIAHNVTDLGYDMDALVDMDVPDANHMNLYFLIGNHVKLGKEKEFRGYLMQKGQAYVPDTGITNALINADTYGDKNFSDFDVFEITEVCHNDREGVIEYYLKCFVEGVEPSEIKID